MQCSFIELPESSGIVYMCVFLIIILCEYMVSKSDYCINKDAGYKGKEFNSLIPGS